MLQTVKDDTGRAEVWNRVQEDEPVVRGISAFSTAAEKRFGQEGVRAMLRAGRPGAKANEGDATVSNEHRAATAEVAWTVAAIKAGEGAAESQVQTERSAQRASEGVRLKL